MKRAPGIANSQLYYRLIALWVLCEAMLGGIIHAFKIPVSGLFVGGAAVICICLIAFYVDKRGAIIRATIIVCIFKMLLSPQAPPLAYFAVAFQGTLGELIFFNKKIYKAGCMILAIVALLESGLQRIAVLTIVYGNGFWKAINDFINDLFKQKNFTNYSLWLAAGYIAIHILAGVVIGYWAAGIPGKIEAWRIKWDQPFIPANKNQPIEVRRKKFRTGMLLTWCVLMLLYFQSYYRIGRPILPEKLPLYILIRSFIIILTWYFILSPVINWLLKRWLQKKQAKSKEEIDAVVKLLPSMRMIISKSWQLSSENKGLKRISAFCKLVLINVIDKE